ncbi:MAG: molybdopterin-dependent oxidoreductase [Chthoniobacterales bacterium]
MSAVDTGTTMLNVQVDGEWLQFPKGTRLIEACTKSGKSIPHYCYHPKLSSPGNCRMCLVEMGMPKMTPDRKPVVGEDGRPEINWMPKPAISCATEISEGMAVRTSSPLVEECRNGVMEFLLINHPLDCPICDQAGECHLQEYSVEFGQGHSRFLEDKVKKPKRVDIGERIVLDDERCIMCSRCIRFMKEIADDDVLGFTERGSHTTLGVYPNKRLDNNYSLNTADICPVGALTSKDFRFKMRVWFLKETKSIDVNCGTGANIIIGSRENVVHRITPRENDFVNSCWMPDSHRLNFHYIHDESRPVLPEAKVVISDSGSEQKAAREGVPWKVALEQAQRELAVRKPEEIAILASGRLTNEEMFLATRLAQALKTEAVDILPREQAGDGFLISRDGNPNTNGAILNGLTGEKPGEKLKQIISGIQEGRIKALVCLQEDAVAAGISEADLAKLDSLIVVDLRTNKTTPLATVLLPSSAFVEKRGSMINIKGRLQRLNAAVTPPGDARDDWEILRDLIQAVSGQNGIYTIEEVFKQMATKHPALADLSLSKIGDLGTQLDLPWVTDREPFPSTMPR